MGGPVADAVPGGTDLLRISQLAPLPDYVKQASVDELSNEDPKLRALFFDRNTGREYPCHTKAACFVSGVRLLLRKVANEPVPRSTTEHAVKMAKHWGISEDLSHFGQQLLAMRNKVATDKTDEPYPVRNAAEARAAAEWLPSAVECRAIETKHAIDLAERVLRYQRDLPSRRLPSLRKIAGRCGVRDLSAVTAYLREREHAQAKQAADLLDAMTVADASEHVPTILKIAAATAEDPHEDVWSAVLGGEGEAEYTFELPGGSVYAGGDLLKLSRNVFKMCLPDVPRCLGEPTPATLKEYCKRAETCEDAETLEQALRDAGVQPLSRRKEASSRLALFAAAAVAAS